MSETPPIVFGPTEGILLMRREGRVFAAHLRSVEAVLTAVWNEPDIPLAAAYFALPTTLEHYEVEASGQADRIWLWEGPDPFAKPEIDSPREEIRS